MGSHREREEKDKREARERTETRESPLKAGVGMEAGMIQPRKEAPNTTGLACNQFSSNVGGLSGSLP
jgi:hypothetical protein